ncbi:slr1699 [Synechocystis sp. PCC 6803]|uniref:Slr1699 protein n=1 Tax=Synechocystis sp. (strain ATCC 27184 / PCC 6803 / Kazusa) TaxID=1111708 RepID=P73194_SYNY3|nr:MULTISPECIES: DUF1350 family protein [unclassified Synechocystis]BAM50940.1 hypothetical protein BEST7613_2009 [Synechocystis sp. PCC 6803] [Bacillus subtilis BEST7613]AGF50910.1 hypothetical protein MYO_16520 [Synechocystis sp. PCC 6803]ALJ66958.1 hypothetical protein AOY38_03320 [Synechocystis sp. PCC 6803]AVP88800.1 DUF1350 domain-containing protein [Synechocystis sp. IPPAS B-1465]MBD2617312.1 DUF1350 family protein [Synechocystis sp. FACHB-898]
MEWREISGSWVLVPPQPIAVVHFLGGAFVGTAPNVAYRWLLTELGKAGYVVVATPFVNTFDHQAIARSVLNRFEIILERLQKQGEITTGLLPVYGLGHSLGCKLHLLIGSLYEVERAGNILVAFNNYPVKQAIPFGEQLAQLQLDKFLTGVQKQLRQLNLQVDLNFEFTPSPEETNLLIAENYRVRRNLLIKFSNDDIDQTLGLRPILNQQTADLVAYCPLPGNHLTPLGQDIQWETGQEFSPLDAVGQWLKNSLSQDLRRLQKEILRWLEPTRFYSGFDNL